MKKVVRYKCSYCQRLAAKPETIERHEQECIHNPNSKNCYKCQFAVQGGYRDNCYGGTDFVSDMPYCSLHEEPLEQIRYCRQDALRCPDYKQGDMYFQKTYNEDGSVTDCFGKPIDLFGGETNENEAN